VRRKCLDRMLIFGSQRTRSYRDPKSCPTCTTITSGYNFRKAQGAGLRIGGEITSGYERRLIGVLAFGKDSPDDCRARQAVCPGSISFGI